jgi:histidinol-phosphate/aromatic aminotransferase/cobyric acid decarboxylase-like protein
VSAHRGRNLYTLLGFAAFRWVEAHGGTHIVAMGRREVTELYLHAGMQKTGLTAQSGAVTYDLLYASVASIRRDYIPALVPVLTKLQTQTDWRLPFPLWRPALCLHGGAFFAAVGERFDHLERSATIINADVLDAWFPPAPGVLTALETHLPWLIRTSPPTECEGFVETVAATRGVARESILPGAGSSDLIFRALRHWLTPRSRALLLDPSYGEYAHLLERVIGCTVDRLELPRDTGYALDLVRLEALLGKPYDLLVLVNPNTPTGRHVPRDQLQRILRRARPSTRVWIDETYIEFAGADETLEAWAAQSENGIVCKSMSKVYALSGIRAAYLCASPHQLEGLRTITPPWVVSLPAQVAAVRALQDPAYYAGRYRETAALRDRLATDLRELGWTVVPSVTNFLLCELPADGPDARDLAVRCREHGLYLREAASISPRFGTRAVRIAVKDAGTNQRMVELLRRLGDPLE